MANTLQRKIAGSEVFCLGFGTANLGGGYSGGQTKPDEERFKLKLYPRFLMPHVADCNLWDTSDAYYDSEELIGKWFKRTGSKRDQIFLASKFGVNRQNKTIDCRPEYARQQVENSLRRLGVDYIDLYYLHRPDSKVPIELTIGALAEFVKFVNIR